MGYRALWGSNIIVIDKNNNNNNINDKNIIDNTIN